MTLYSTASDITQVAWGGNVKMDIITIHTEPADDLTQQFFLHGTTQYGF